MKAEREYYIGFWNLENLFDTEQASAPPGCRSI